METLFVILQVVVAALLVASTAETFRARPWWPSPPGRPASKGPARGSSPRERRWIHGGLALVLLSNLAAVRLDEDLASLAVALLLAGVAAAVVGFVRGASDEDRRRFAERYGTATDGDASDQHGAPDEPGDEAAP